MGDMPGREQDFAETFRQALDYVVAVGGSAIHCMAGVAPPGTETAAEATFIGNLKAAAPLAALMSGQLPDLAGDRKSVV